MARSFSITESRRNLSSAPLAAALVALGIALPGAAAAETVGSVDTAFKLIGRKIGRAHV